MKHYYIRSDWSILETDEHILYDSREDMEIRFEFQDKEESLDYQSDPIKFVFENDLVTFRSGCIQECTREEIINGSTQICVDIIMGSQTRYKHSTNEKWEELNNE